MSNPSPSTHILLVEPQFVLRRTIVAVSSDLGIAELQEATSVDAAVSKLAAHRFDGLVIAIDDGPAAIDLLSRLRRGGFASAASTPVIALTSGAIGLLDARLGPFGLMATLRKPFKVAELLQAMQRIAPALTHGLDARTVTV